MHMHSSILAWAVSRRGANFEDGAIRCQCRVWWLVGLLGQAILPAAGCRTMSCRPDWPLSPGSIASVG